ncbi:hypothetical protein PsorP6_010109 [Peronosclerospora sorghi]|uniref:Uncharacterized protein n=1 Tax=Peronosclerospora sorghi TaxID=230839 RepID=A0ACC0VX57_9STRA|nr:hypothetical protein PsorP6_010109 [Peronosclerospora sorghi]
MRPGSHKLDKSTTVVKVANLPEEPRVSVVLTRHFGQAALNHGNVFAKNQLEMGWVESEDAPAELTRTDSPIEAAAVRSEDTGSSNQVRSTNVAWVSYFSPLGVCGVLNTFLRARSG